MFRMGKSYLNRKNSKDYDPHKPFIRDENRSDDRYTPLWLFKKLDAIYHFTTDPCTDPNNRLGCKVHYTKNYGPKGDGNGLVAPWQGNTFINPPYGPKSTPYWVRAAREYADNTGNYVVMLLKATTDVQWYHTFVWAKERRGFRDGVDVDFIEHRVNFLDINGKELDAAPFSSMLVEFHRPGSESKLTGWYKINPVAAESKSLDEMLWQRA